MSTRSYLSIGDVLSLLRQEFPDVTISKIRFLESQGLVNPERTPSGYRKFYEHDVERLRWVLRQQREHFLPLKVIKDRLDDEPVAGEQEPSRRTAAGRAADEGSSDGRGRGAADEQEEQEERAVLVGQRAAAEGGRSTLPGLGSTSGASAPSAPSAPSTSSTGGSAPGGSAGVPVPAPSSGLAVADAAHGPVTAEQSNAATGSAGNEPRPGGSPSASAARRSRPDTRAGTDPAPSPGRQRPDPSVPADPSLPADPSAASSAASPRAAETPARANRPPAPPPSDVGAASLSVDELASASGLEVGMVRELEEFGLLCASNVAGVECFGEDALAVARLAAQFSRFGIEARHLRLYKNAAEREAGFVEQVVLPLVRQRNPDARARAHETADELALLGQQLHSALLRRALGDLLGG